jgi:hypothetical protein
MSETDSADRRLRDELASFERFWQGGFFSGDPMDRMYSPHDVFGYVGIYYAIYLACIKPYVGPETVALELGPGRGAWTRTLLSAREVWALDALSAEHNSFWEYVGRADNVRYVQVRDFSCSMLPDNSIDYVFSYDTLCHVSFEGIEAYVANLRPKLHDGAHGFVMVADFAKYRRFIEAREQLSVFNRCVGYFSSRPLRRLLAKRARELNENLMRRFDEFMEEPEANGWFHAGADRTCELLERYGYTVVDRDMDIDPKSPIVHFVK